MEVLVRVLMESQRANRLALVAIVLLCGLLMLVSVGGLAWAADVERRVERLWARPCGVSTCVKSVHGVCTAE